MTTINNLSIEQMREIVDGAPEGATHKDEVFGYVKFKWVVGDFVVFDEWCPDDAPVTKVFKTNWHENSTELNIFKQSSVDLNNLRTAIAKHDSREFKVGDLVVSTWGLEKRVFKVELKPKFKNGILYLTLLIDGSRRECLAQWWRKATSEEIDLGARS
ncbi:hypothetical protein [Acinetobacter bereziniae]|uniref:hypothetical protein n=1 Tax=Acinetobacter bereziniae TaxID=106648 RepID=UPI0012507F7B|nr:hypothetical protein [Acinetobacter bereziniae]